MIKDSQKILSIFAFIDSGFFDNAVGFTILCTKRLLNIVGRSFSNMRWKKKLRFVFMKFSNGVMFITPDIGKSGFYCNKALTNIEPNPCVMINVDKSLSQQFLNKVSISANTLTVDSLTLDPPE